MASSTPVTTQVGGTASSEKLEQLTQDVSLAKVDDKNNAVSPTHAENPTPPPQQPMEGEELLQAVVRQVEWYLGRQNLSTDYYLMQQMQDDFFVKLSVLANFPKMKKMAAGIDAQYLASAIKGRSVELELDETDTMVRPVFLLSEKRRSILILRELPAATPIPDIEALFAESECPKPENIRPDVGDTWFVAFDSFEHAKTALDRVQDKNINGYPIKARVKTESISRTVAGAVSGVPMGNAPVVQGMPGQQPLPPHVMMPPPMGPFGPIPPMGYGFAPPPPPGGFRGPPQGFYPPPPFAAQGPGFDPAMGFVPGGVPAPANPSAGSFHTAAAAAAGGGMSSGGPRGRGGRGRGSGRGGFNTGNFHGPSQGFTTNGAQHFHHHQHHSSHIQHHQGQHHANQQHQANQAMANGVPANPAATSSSSGVIAPNVPSPGNPLSGSSSPQPHVNASGKDSSSSSLPVQQAGSGHQGGHQGAASHGSHHRGGSNENFSKDSSGGHYQHHQGGGRNRYDKAGGVGPNASASGPNAKDSSNTAAQGAKDSSSGAAKDASGANSSATVGSGAQGGAQHQASGNTGSFQTQSGGGSKKRKGAKKDGDAANSQGQGNSANNNNNSSKDGTSGSGNNAGGNDGFPKKKDHHKQNQQHQQQSQQNAQKEVNLSQHFFPPLPLGNNADSQGSGAPAMSTSSERINSLDISGESKPTFSEALTAERPPTAASFEATLPVSTPPSVPAVVSALVSESSEGFGRGAVEKIVSSDKDRKTSDLADADNTASGDDKKNDQSGGSGMSYAAILRAAKKPSSAADNSPSAAASSSPIAAAAATAISLTSSAKAATGPVSPGPAIVSEDAAPTFSNHENLGSAHGRNTAAAVILSAESEGTPKESPASVVEASTQTFQESSSPAVHANPTFLGNGDVKKPIDSEKFSNVDSNKPLSVWANKPKSVLEKPKTPTLASASTPPASASSVGAAKDAKIENLPPKKEIAS
eukprot:CAMPEP_0184692636 /NCGR_PEP_ID=MMETSP0313-20130426/1028_1 /TAXON_ID=2792 /ORGANISM="Porphyridium aerugineum, Strain SAG 1380-2" /LENGTH=981 /DNA_ID=CAMNT_0027150479 /DNA_START=687 /DNA_END=3629 /DNA_ORIENTATION=-